MVGGWWLGVFGVLGWILGFWVWIWGFGLGDIVIWGFGLEALLRGCTLGWWVGGLAAYNGL